VKQKLDNLIQNESFLNYYFQKNESDIWEWEEFQEENPESVFAINLAKESLNKLSLRWSEEEIREKYQRLSIQIEDNKPTINFISKSTFSISIGIAASLLLILGVYWLFLKEDVSPIYKQLTQEKQLIETINNTPKPMLVLLQDGSSIMLESDSRLSYPKVFNEDKREVFLDGEAFFEVSKNPQKPFYVYANEIVTKVIGTSFTIKSVKNQKTINVKVNTGKVSVYSFKELKSKTAQKMHGGVLVTENQQINFDKDQINFTKTLLDKPQLLELKQNYKFEFIDATATEVFKVIQKAYGINIVFDDEILNNCPVTASLSDEPLFGKVELICQAIEAEYEVLDGQIIITSKGCR
jgi:transmembrane sensor